MTENYRVKLRTCIRKGTYQYSIDKDQVEMIWQELEKEFGKAKKWGDFEIMVIENDQMILRRNLLTNKILLIEKKRFCPKNEMILREILKVDT